MDQEALLEPVLAALRPFAKTFRSLTENPVLGRSKIAQSLGVPGLNTSGSRSHFPQLLGSGKQETRRFSHEAAELKPGFFSTGSDSGALEKGGGSGVLVFNKHSSFEQMSSVVCLYIYVITKNLSYSGLKFSSSVPFCTWNYPAQFSNMRLPGSLLGISLQVGACCD